MKQFLKISEERAKILKKDERWKKELKKFLDVEIEINNEVFLESENVLDLLKLKKIFECFDFGFEFKDCICLLDEDYVFEKIDLKDYAKSLKRILVLKGRVIGRKGKSKNLIENYSNSKILIKEKEVGILGKWNEVDLAKKAIEMILKGAKHGTVFKFLEENKIR